MNQTSSETPPDGHDHFSSGNKRPLDSGPSTKKTDKLKRLRVSRACDQCRAARERCDGGQPTCNTCLQAERSCSYKEQPKKRGIQPNYIRTLELTLAWLFQSNPGVERQLAEVLPNSEGQAHRTIAFKDIPSADTLHQVWRHGIVCRQIDQLLSGAEIEVPRLEIVESSTSTSSAVKNHPYQSPPLSAPSDVGTLHLENESRTNFCNAAAARQDTAATEDEPVDRIFLPSDAWPLLEHYFAFTHTWLPITEKIDVLRLMYTYPRQGLSKARMLGSEHAELWAIMACSAYQLNSRDSWDDSEFCSKVAESLIPMSGFALGHVKALLILCLIYLSESSWTRAWLTVGKAVRILTHLAADAPGDGTIPRGRHIFLAAYLLESAVACKTSALPHLRTDDVQPMGLLIEDGLEEWAPWSDPGSKTSIGAGRQPARAISTFNEMVKVALRNKVSQPIEPQGRGVLAIVLELLSNARIDGERQHPSGLVAEFISTQGLDRLDSRDDRMRPPSAVTQSHSQLDDLEHWQKQGSLVGVSADHQHYPFVSMPNEANDSTSSNTPSWVLPAGDMPIEWQNKSLHPEAPGSAMSKDICNTSIAKPSADIFEELAILERTDASQNPRFLQNLGFGPDLDLAEFFGADYQPSDPMLNYMPSEMPHGHEGAVNSAN